MNNNLQLFFIFVFCSFVEGVHVDGIDHSVEIKCIKLKNVNLEIPENEIVKGEGREGDASWYKYINWLKNPVGLLTVHYARYLMPDKWKPLTATHSRKWSVRPKEESDWEMFVKRLLGLSNGFPTIPGKVEVPPNLLDGEPPCIHFTLEGIVWSGEYIVDLDYHDEVGNWILAGNVTFNN